MPPAQYRSQWDEYFVLSEKKEVFVFHMVGAVFVHEHCRIPMSVQGCGSPGGAVQQAGIPLQPLM